MTIRRAVWLIRLHAFEQAMRIALEDDGTGNIDVAGEWHACQRPFAG